MMEWCGEGACERRSAAKSWMQERLCAALREGCVEKLRMEGKGRHEN